ncbi:MAG: TetR/AcrR family transcriptional regulator [Alphaproteobacteria bacterium]|jgi:AcrR family transcriptional regulator|nr:TetR/AcrR family transcriptional regulator [Alphaproteobacteria bacterium]
MSPRRYRADRRKAAAEETRRRIVEATVALHAEQGVVATTYAMIAERADVAIPTVYNHFPSQGALLGACTGHAAAQAPPLGPQIYDGASDLEDRLRTLVRALFAYYRYYDPWMRWGVHEAPLLPDLAAALEKTIVRPGPLIALALAPAFGNAPPASLVALCEILLDFPAWQRLDGEPGLGPTEAESVLADALVALARRHGEAQTVTDHRG